MVNCVQLVGESTCCFPQWWRHFTFPVAAHRIPTSPHPPPPACLLKEGHSLRVLHTRPRQQELPLPQNRPFSRPTWGPGPGLLLTLVFPLLQLALPSVSLVVSSVGGLGLQKLVDCRDDHPRGEAQGCLLTACPCLPGATSAGWCQGRLFCLLGILCLPGSSSWKSILGTHGISNTSDPAAETVQSWECSPEWRVLLGWCVSFLGLPLLSATDSVASKEMYFLTFLGLKCEVMVSPEVVSSKASLHGCS